jgi:hypothetical protein
MYPQLQDEVFDKLVSYVANQTASSRKGLVDSLTKYDREMWFYIRKLEKEIDRLGRKQTE